MASQISTGAEPFNIQYRMQAEGKQSPRSLHARIRPSEYCTQNWDSSGKNDIERNLYPILSFSALESRSLYATLSMENEVIATMLIIHTDANVFALRELTLVELKTFPFPELCSVM
ncbi:hypothetical protein TNCV_4608961 [Trichonephila clavipes]|nr:hypothetical protein TNCV_4608961 [Trichonephila clavipes]